MRLVHRSHSLPRVPVALRHTETNCPNPSRGRRVRVAKERSSLHAQPTGEILLSPMIIILVPTERNAETASVSCKSVRSRSDAGSSSHALRRFELPGIGAGCPSFSPLVWVAAIPSWRPQQGTGNLRIGHFSRHDSTSARLVGTNADGSANELAPIQVLCFDQDSTSALIGPSPHIIGKPLEPSS